jgi:putative ABC transport system substrate-binding protein
MPERMADLIRATPDMIVASGNLATRAAQSETKTIPIVFAPVGDAIRNGYTSSLARPDKNLTGFSLDTHVLNQKRIEALRDYFPSVRRVAVLVNSANPSADGQWELTRMAALAFGLEPELISAYARELDGAFAAIAALEPDALHVVTDAIFDTERERIVAFAAERRLPSIYEHRAFTESGGLISYGPNLDHMSARAATYVDRIARGVPIRDIPVETPINLELVVNLKTAKALGIAISADLLARADEVIE